jgi:hypothetical protein
MLAPSADRNLLFGVLALQMDFIIRDALKLLADLATTKDTKPE